MKIRTDNCDNSNQNINIVKNNDDGNEKDCFNLKMTDNHYKELIPSYNSSLITDIIENVCEIKKENP